MKIFLSIVISIYISLFLSNANAMHCNGVKEDLGTNDRGDCQTIKKENLGSTGYCFVPDGFDVIPLKKDIDDWKTISPARLQQQSPTGYAQPARTNGTCSNTIDILFNSNDEKMVDLFVAKDNSGTFFASIPGMFRKLELVKMTNSDLEVVWLESKGTFAYKDQDDRIRNMKLYLFLRNSIRETDHNLAKFFYVVAIDSNDAACMASAPDLSKKTVDAKSCADSVLAKSQKRLGVANTFQETGVGGGGEGN